MQILLQSEVKPAHFAIRKITGCKNFRPITRS